MRTAIFLRGENPAGYGGSDSDNDPTILVQYQYGYVSRIES
jgi:hypothetical protein